MEIALKLSCFLLNMIAKFIQCDDGNYMKNTKEGIEGHPWQNNEEIDFISKPLLNVHLQGKDQYLLNGGVNEYKLYYYK